MKDALVIGMGISGACLSAELMRRNLSVDVADEGRKDSPTRISSGIYNPVVLKRRRVVWKAIQMLEALKQLYSWMEYQTNSPFHYPESLLEILPNPVAQNDWIALSDQPVFVPFTGKVSKNFNPKIKAKHFGEVLQSGRIDPETFLDNWKNHLQTKNCLIDKRIEPVDCIQTKDGWTVHGREYKNLIWCEGYSPTHPHFGKLPFQPTKGENLIVRANDLDLDRVLHGSVFILPLGDQHYMIGSTFSRDVENPHPSEEGKTELLKRWKTIVDCPCTVVDHRSGIRPNVRDRRPLLGESPANPGSHIFTGMGSRGILMAPWLAAQMAQLIATGQKLPGEVDIRRFS